MPFADTLFLIGFVGMGTVLCSLGFRQVWLDIEAWQQDRMVLRQTVAEQPRIAAPYRDAIGVMSSGPTA
ncbi:MAG: hypothetical protein AAF337_02225 [Pseudomonadota bacterium]